MKRSKLLFSGLFGYLIDCLSSPSKMPKYSSSLTCLPLFADHYPSVGIKTIYRQS